MAHEPLSPATVKRIVDGHQARFRRAVEECRPSREHLVKLLAAINVTLAAPNMPKSTGRVLDELLPPNKEDLSAQIALAATMVAALRSTCAVS